MGELLYGDVPRIIGDVQLAADDPARPYLGDNRSLIAIPHYDRGVGQNMVLMLRKEPHAFPPEQFPDWFWMSSLFGRATQNLVLSAELKKAYGVVERELNVVAEIQRSLLPKTIPPIPTLSVAAFYQTSQWAGGDYYDFFPLPDGKWGHPDRRRQRPRDPGGRPDGRDPQLGPRLPRSSRPAQRPAEQGQSAARDPLHRQQRGVRHRLLRDLRPEHPSPELLQRRPQPAPIDPLRGLDRRLARHAQRLPLGLFADEVYEDSTLTLRPGDRLAFYTDGITEAIATGGRMFGLERLDEVLSRCGGTAQDLVDNVVREVRAFTLGEAPADDQTLLGMIVFLSPGRDRS